MKKNYLLPLAGSLLMATTAFGQTRTVNGRITDASGAGLPGVTVLEQGTTNGTSSGVDGSFSLAVQPGATLVISSIGFDSQTIVVGSRSSLDVSLKSNATQLSEAVVVGYGTQAKAELTGAVTQLSARDVENQPVVSFEQAIQGRTPGVAISQGSGKLGAGVQIRVRGSASVTASNQPLYVIDNIPVTSQDDSQANGDPVNPIADLNPNDIESITILKDAASSAIYGSRASNGVILITTKQGRQGKTKVNVGYYVGTSTPTRQRKFLNSAQYKELFSEAITNVGLVGPDPNTQYPDVASVFADYGGIDFNAPYDTNWGDQAFRDHGAVSQYDVSVSGGDAKTRFYLSGTFNDQKGIIIGNRYRRGSLRLNLDHSISEKVKVGVNLSLTRSVNDRTSDDNAFSNPLQLNALPPLQPVYDPDTRELNTNTLYYNNLLDQSLGSNRAGNYRSFNNVFLNWQPVKGLVLRTEVGSDFLNLNEDLVRGAGTQDGGATGFAYNAQTQTVNYTTNNTANYTYTLNENHRFEALAGYSYQRSDTKLTAAEGRGFPTSEFTRIASAAVKTGGNQSFGTGFSFSSFFGRLNYSFLNKFLLSGSVRRDGSSRFGANNKYGVFGAGSVGYVLTEESFLKDNAVLSLLKVRASYGQTGNAEIGNFSSRSLFGALPYADQSGTGPSNVLGNPDLTWETTKQADIGLDYALFNNRISGEFDIYEKKTTGLLLNRQVPYTGGYSIITENTGKLRNRGLEFSINGRILEGPVVWTVGGNISFNRNEITSLPQPIIPGGNTLSQVRQGEPIGVFWGKKYAGVDPENGDALYYNADGSTTNSYAAAPNQKLGNPNPKYTGGVNTTASFKGFDLSALGQFTYGNDLYNGAGVYQSVNGDFLDNQTVDQLQRWQKKGDVTSVPQARFLESNGTGTSSRWIQSGSFFRIKNITLGYNLPASLAKRGFLQTARVYVTAQNLATFTNYTGYDPEVISGLYNQNTVLGHDFYTPPLAKTFLVGVNLGL
ncbi:SusC/RagA family TonB-linked outer membrane protein [Hymenobacter actinosclerus]|uniref:TonB-linked outer membrane protein, SusC/RagA family n=1 Tax=Hymenobacter actinosclerus TaxID=82805 RepID=A0A1I0ASC0_9BACT|nr:TonB-dependent receptor [Hymenobacter actinosclerus]SES97255.1 TonB-linked outer membrane protein, SusC/RagA family [Hymenobacter actinosclerus]